MSPVAPGPQAVFDPVAGPQGSGKSTFFPVAGRGYDAFNIDDRRRALNGGSSRLIPDTVRRQAATEYEAFIKGHLRKRMSLSIEVTLAKEITFKQAQKARKAGFRLQLTYVAAEIDKCIRRVANRLDRGGHGVPPEVIRETHAASLRNLARALAEFDIVQVYDNSREAGLDDDLVVLMPRLVLETQGGKAIFIAGNLPGWLKSALAGTDFQPGS